MEDELRATHERLRKAGLGDEHDPLPAPPSSNNTSVHREGNSGDGDGDGDGHSSGEGSGEGSGDGNDDDVSSDGGESVTEVASRALECGRAVSAAVSKVVELLSTTRDEVSKWA